MTHFVECAALAAAKTHTPVAWYFDRTVAAAEARLLFARGPRYVGHELMTPEIGDYHTLEWMGHAKALVRNDNGIELMSNVCRHRQSILRKGHGNAGNIVCPLHRWTYDIEGKLLGAPHFPANPCLDLGKTRLARWNGLLFEGERDVARDLAQVGVMGEIDFNGYRFDRVEIDEYPFNWKTFVEVYLEDYHVIPYHPGLGGFVDCDELNWQFGDRFSVQTVGIKQNLARPGTQNYGKWHEQVLRYGDGAMPKYGAVWMIYYPNVMIEWYPHVLVISTLIPRGAEACTNIVEFYFPEEIALFERDYVEAERVAYDETAREDDEICQLMTEGRRALYEQGRSEAGPYQSPMEDGLQHFHEFLQRELGQHLDSV
ncbi:MAG: aromatic ring-hydroxylating dioxygenase subunit alpha [Burkholderiales bacterium]|nr:aromatic ring-hydroxylating dioxygenase subunit alpha [Burkholderiales bacterium]